MTDSEIFRDRANELEALARFTTFPSAVTNPLFEVTGSRQKCVASCVLVAIGPYVALVTAAHALKSNESYKFGAGNQLLPVHGRARSTLAPTDDPKENDFIDLKCVLLDDAVATQIERQFILHLNQIENADGIAVDGLYLATGYPYSKQRKYRWNRDNAAKNHEFVLTREPYASYAELGIDPLGTIITRFDKEDVFRSGRKNTAPDPYGMSGGSLWKLSRENPADPKLAGILIEWHDKHRGNRILATRAHVALQLLLELEPGLAQWIRVSDSAT